MCGEHRNPEDSLAHIVGSSPHVRGTLPSIPSRAHLHGIIPACAGNTLWSRNPSAYFGDHPRMCGEHSAANVRMLVHMGSSPHVRGTLVDVDIVVVFRGIIPACAGNTRHRRSRASIPWDHPRMCGEHRTGYPYVTAEQGSSPHVRGTLETNWKTAELLGIIPACAGNTSSRGRSGFAAGDHPRMCGEHVRKATIATLAAGSSPHVRGTPVKGVS